MTVNGSGDDVIEIVRPDGPGQVTLVTASHSGGSNFVVRGGSDLLVNEIGAYEGTTLLADSGADLLEVKADGSWTISFTSALLAPEMGDASEGVGDSILLYVGSGRIAEIAHAGSSNFVVRFWPLEGRRNLAVNEIGAYSGRVPWEFGPGIVEIKADGPWSISIA